MRALPLLLLAIAATLLGAAPALAGGLVQVDGTVLRFTGDDGEPSNVTIDDAAGTLRLTENASRMTAGPGCLASPDGYEVDCADGGVERIAVTLGDIGSDVRIRADLPSEIHGGAGDDLLIGGPADDTIDGGAGQDILGGGLGADVLNGGRGEDLVTYEDQIAADGALDPRRTGVHVEIGRPDVSGGTGERDTIARDVEQVQGGAGADRFELRDGLSTAVACGDKRDTVVADPRDTIGIDCESTHVAPQRLGARLTIPTLAYPFTGIADRGSGTIVIDPILPLQHGSIVLRVTCPPGVGLLELVKSMGCRGLVRFTRGNVWMGTQRVDVPHGRAITLRLPLTGSRRLARGARGLAVTATALPYRGKVARRLRFTVRG